ncbi:hypothetical protein [Corynebacterium cystitidis]|uniref:hypothetical protein n=1 Tax=Corynebacterium cystitidis TaxID=35757 RepID=UPI00211E9582|nr:hypothetical protein [Corynebacterium cystitidis]
MVAFTTVEQLRSRWSEAPDDDELLAEKIEDAAVWLRAWFPSIPNSLSDQLAAALRVVNVSMVKRALVAGNSQQFESITDAAGPFSRSRSFRNPDGDLFLTKQEQVMLQRALDAELGQATGFRSVEARF